MDIFKTAGLVGRILAALFGVLGIIGFAVVLGNGIDKDTMDTLLKLGTEEGMAEAASFSGSVNFFLSVTLWALILAVALIAIFVVYTAVIDWKKLLKPVIFAAGAGLIFLITWSMAKGRETYNLKGKSIETVETIRAVPDGAFYFADAALLALGIIMTLTILLVIYTEVSRLFK